MDVPSEGISQANIIQLQINPNGNQRAIFGSDTSELLLGAESAWLTRLASSSYWCGSLDGLVNPHGYAVAALLDHKS
jgi:hypothetical protein